MSNEQWVPIDEPLDFFDSKQGLTAQLAASVIRVELGDKLCTINFSDDEPLIRVCELVADRRTEQPAPQGPEPRLHDGIVSALIAKISNISEEGWHAQWLGGCEYAVWEEIHSDNTGWLSDKEKGELLAIAQFIGGWVEWDDDAGDPIFVPMDKWLQRQRPTQEGGSHE